jgi:resuscitation-promoting factor RpfA
MVKPLVNVNSTPAFAKPAAAPTRTRNNPMLIAGAGVLALLIIAAAAFALMRRRRRVAEDAWIDEEPMQYEPAETAMVNEPEPAPIGNEEQPPIVAPAASAFAWGDDASSRAGEESMVEDERQQGESWIERAYRGPSPSNPSVSLKARLRRAAFFDKRERDAAAGKAEPLDTSAGLPDALVREQEDELA